MIQKRLPFKNRYGCIVPFEEIKIYKIFGSSDSTNVLKRSIRIRNCSNCSNKIHVALLYLVYPLFDASILNMVDD